MKILIAVLLALAPSAAFADECLMMKDSRYTYDFHGDAVTIVGKTCETSSTHFINDIATDQTITCHGMKKPVTVSFQGGEFFANQGGKEEQLVEACQ
jgi:hypothetical protein